MIAKRKRSIKWSTVLAYVVAGVVGGTMGLIVSSVARANGWY
jgi:Na+/H+ antiporter NhaA